MKINEKLAKSVITKSGLPGADFVLNPYTVCSHSCIYCYADFIKRFTGHGEEDWGDFVDVKINAPELIEKDMMKTPSQSLILIGSVTDPYQPLEDKYKITRKCLEEFLKLKLIPELQIITKSPLVTRDIDLFNKFKNIRVAISLGILNEELARDFEPYAPSPLSRLDALKKLDKEGIKTALFVSPILPGISEVEKIIDAAKDFVDEMWFENINVRANNRERILSLVKFHRPKLLHLYEGLDKNITYWNEVERKIRRKCKKEGIRCKIYFNHWHE